MYKNAHGVMRSGNYTIKNQTHSSRLVLQVFQDYVRNQMLSEWTNKIFRYDSPNILKGNPCEKEVYSSVLLLLLNYIYF